MALVDEETGHFGDHEETVLYVQHGATASTARPTLGEGATAATVVIWDGSVDPDNKVSGDYWSDTANDVWKRYDGSVWVTIGSGAYATEAIEEAEPDGTTVDFTSIPQTYQHLLLRASARSNRASTTPDSMVLNYNGNTSGTNYTYVRSLNTGAAITPGTANAPHAAILTSDNATAGEFATLALHIPNYTASKRHIATCVGHEPSNPYLFHYGHRWGSSDPISRVTLSLITGTGFVAGSVFTLYGIKGS